MKYLNFLVVLPFFVVLTEGKTQCIDDVRYLIDSPEPCFFIGMVDMTKTECFDPLNPDWTYQWTIKNAESGEMIAQYDGYAFSHSIETFGGYEFCLSIDKDGNPQTPAEVVNCVTYTTCEPCTKGTIDYEYVDCGSPSGCKLKLSGMLPAINAHGVKEFAKLVVTYIPTPEQALAGLEPYDLIFDHIPVTFHPAGDSITIDEEVTVPYARGCYEQKIIMNLDYGEGAHSEYGGPGCDEIVIYGDKVFRCLACSFGEGGDCAPSATASDIANETGTCEPTGCLFGLEERNANPDEFENTTERFNAYPNPADEQLTIAVPGTWSESYSVRLVNTVGQTVTIQAVTGGSTEVLSLRNVPNGVYLLVVSDGTTTSFKKKILVSHR
ncbi:MAG: hypothetical protein CMN32_15785 [Saprospirales bacterium]|nr:hypothetical protein [Saprospirales bacterium]